jgi:hypothetical protein
LILILALMNNDCGGSKTGQIRRDCGAAAAGSGGRLRRPFEEQPACVVESRKATTPL